MHANRCQSGATASPILQHMHPHPQQPAFAAATTCLLRQDLANEVAAAAANMAPHLLAIAIEDESGHLGEAGREEGLCSIVCQRLQTR